MFGRRATIGLALLCALLFSAIAVQSASAAAATNTTLFTCVKTAVPETGTFNDEHCDSDNVNKKGNFEHEKLPVNPPETTEVETTNDTTGTKSPLTLKGTPFGVKTHIECTTGTGTGSGGNTEPKVKEHKISGKGTSKFTGCTAKEPAKCTVKEPIEVIVGSIEGLEGLTGPNGEEKAMGGELKAEAGKPFATITLEGPECGLKGKPFPVEGSVTATSGPPLEAGKFEKQTNKWSGATSMFYMSSLTAGGKPAEFICATTVRMKGKGNPIVATTVT